MLSDTGGADAGSFARPGFGRTRLVVHLSLFMAMAGYGITVPVMPFLARDLGASPVGVSLLVSLYALTQFFSGPVWGAISDRYGRRKVLVAGLVGYAASFFLAGLSSSVAALVGSRALGGLLSGSIFPSAQALVADITGPRERGPAMASLGAWTNLGFLTGPVIGGVLAPLGYAPPLFIAGAVVLATAVMAATGMREDPARAGQTTMAAGAAGVTGAAGVAETVATARAPASRGWPSLADLAIALRSRMSPYLALNFGISFSVSGLTALLAYFIIDRLGGQPTDAGLIFSAQGLVAFVVQALLVGKLMRRFGERNLALAGVAVTAAGFLALVPATHIVPAVVGAMIVGLGSSLLRPSLTSAVSLLTPLPQGISLGVQSSFDSLGRVAGPTLGGWLYETSPTLPFWSAVLVLSGLGSWAAWKTVRRDERYPAKE